MKNREADIWRGKLELLLEKANKHVKELEVAENNLSELREVHDLFSLIRQRKIKSKKEWVSSLINQAIHDIFDRDITFQIQESESDPSRFNMVIKDEADVVMSNQEAMDAMGGGVLAVISTLLKIMVGMFHENERLYFLDESFSQVSPQYRHRLAAYLKSLCEENQMTLVLVAQVDDMDEHAHCIYELDKKDGLVIKNKKCSSSGLPHFYTLTIKNFQSIASIEYHFEGLTIIKGRNSIGKSASLRAFDALVYNKFKPSMKRLGLVRGERCEVAFAKQSPQGELYSFRAVYDGTSVVYHIGGETYKGKQCSASSLRVIFNDLGFKRYLPDGWLKKKSVKEREQLDCLNSSTQYDPLFMIANSTSENNVIFSHLFGAQGVNVILEKVQSGQREASEEIKRGRAAILLLREEITQAERSLKLAELEYGIACRKELIELVEYRGRVIAEGKSVRQRVKLAETLFEKAERENRLERLQLLLESASQAHAEKKRLEKRNQRLDGFVKGSDRAEKLREILRLQELIEKNRVELSTRSKWLPKQKIGVEKFEVLQRSNQELVAKRKLLDTGRETLKRVGQQLKEAKEWQELWLKQNHLEVCSCCGGSGLSSRHDKPTGGIENHG